MKNKTKFLICLLLAPLSLSIGQTKKLENTETGILNQALDSVMKLSYADRMNFLGFEGVSIYEYGDSIKDCETNFINLFNNWTPKFITNARQYKLINYSFVESIKDSARYIFYRNYFLGEEALVSSISTLSGQNSDGETYHEEYIDVNHRYENFYDPRKLPKKLRAIYSDELLSEARKIILTPINIDTSKLYYYKSFSYNKDSGSVNNGPFYGSEEFEKFTYSKIASTDSLSQNYVDVFVNKTKRPEDLSPCEAGNLLLEEIKVNRINEQLWFNNTVNLGDKVYKLSFLFKGRSYNTYIICSNNTKRVVMDFVFDDLLINPQKK